jgi:ABC-2 type transport system ATP-binding protein
MTKQQYALELQRLLFRWKPDEATLRSLSLSVETGEAVGLLGRNGAGKTSLMRILTGQVAAQGGQVRVLGLDPMEQGTELRRRIGFVPENNEFPGHLSVSQVFALHRSLFPSWDEGLRRELQERFRVPSKKRVDRLSKGEARQLALLCALAHRPELLLLDEPASGLDPAMRREFLEAALQAMNDDTTLLFSSHNVQDLERLSTRIVVIDEGRVLVDAPSDSFQDSYCLFRAPVEPGSQADTTLREYEPCVRVHQRNGEVLAVLRGSPSDHASALAERDLHARHCQSAPLEELFIGLVGGRT